MSYNVPDPFSLPQLKIQLLEELLLDKTLNDREFRLAASLVLMELRQFEKPACVTDQSLSEHLGQRSVDTVSRAVQALGKLSHFHIKRGTRNRATEYSISANLREKAIERKMRRVVPECSAQQICSSSPANVQETTPQMCHPILKNINNKPITRVPAREEAEKFEEIWNAYPQVGRKHKASCEKSFYRAIQSGESPEAILQSVKNYAKHSKSFSAEKVSFSNNWFWKKRWKEFGDEALEPSKLSDIQNLGVLKTSVEWLKSGTDLARQVSPSMKSKIVKYGLMTRDQILSLSVAS